MRLVSVGIPVRDGEAYLDQALGSILSQTYEHLEVVIGDNASTDGTEEICRRHAARDPRVTYIRHPANLGAGPNHNMVFERSSGDYFRWATHDDVLAPELIERCVSVLDAQPDVALAYTRTRLIDEAGEWMGDYPADCPWQGATPSRRLDDLLNAERTLLHKCYPIYGLMRSEMLRRTPVIAPYNSSDAVLLVELALRGRYHEIPEYLFSSRRHPDSSLQVNKTPAEVMRWFDPDADGSFPAPRSRLLAGYLGAIRRSPMPAAERLACTRVVMKWVTRNSTWKVIGGELKIKARESTGRRRPAGV